MSSKHRLTRSFRSVSAAVYLVSGKCPWRQQHFLHKNIISYIYIRYCLLGNDPDTYKIRRRKGCAAVLLLLVVFFFDDVYSYPGRYVVFMLYVFIDFLTWIRKSSLTFTSYSLLRTDQYRCINHLCRQKGVPAHSNWHPNGPNVPNHAPRNNGGTAVRDEGP